jgi:hypothetical protein
MLAVHGLVYTSHSHALPLAADTFPEDSLGKVEIHIQHNSQLDMGHKEPHYYQFPLADSVRWGTRHILICLRLCNLEPGFSYYLSKIA